MKQRAVHRQYFFEIFILINFMIILLLLRRITDAPLRTLPSVLTAMGAGFALRIQADQILPELAVSQVLAYHLAENELALDAEIELEVREAPLRELLVHLPKGYAIARLSAS